MSLKTDWPQLAYIALTLIGLGADISRHGEQKTSKRNCFTSLVETAIIAWILYCGGFFT